ncbi:MFS general substrate transporter [Penicillium odoratum]|uniref:MFS general substrate transporter n=1 Tax=Penicillium odoratum TaxID=1167516 RepID=UPI00254713C6|nr:MFS general substrate transporter [Penicillium odoratum]KAJ5751993.1 MFS general substrate transporter [Penicillium odoratum]
MSTVEPLSHQDPDIPPEWDWAKDKENPRNWSRLQKFATAFTVCSIGFTTTVGASIYSPGHNEVKQEFNVSSTVSLLPLSAYTLGLAFGPVISSPLSEAFGRRFVYMVTLPLFDIFMLATGLTHGIASLTICRFLAGFFAAPGVSVSAAVICDFTSPEHRVIPLAGYYAMPWLGSAVGPLIGGFVVQAKGWRWTSWVVLMMAAAFHPPVLFLRESFKTTILQRKNRGKVTEVSDTCNRETVSPMRMIQTFITSTIIRPLHMLITEPLVGLICMYTGFQFVLLYTFIVASPWVFETVYGFSLTSQSLSFLGMISGCIFAPFVFVAVESFLRSHHPQPESSALHNVERKLHAALYGSFLLPFALFWFAWSARPSVHWICPIFAQGVAFICTYLIYVACSSYMVQIYGAKYGASANGASSFSRYTLSAAFPLFVTQMYEALGVGWATSLLGFLALGMAPIPWMFSRYGPAFRARSAYEHGT